MVANEMTIELDMFGSLMKNRVSCNVKGDFIITIKSNRLSMWNTKIMKKRFQPNQFTAKKCHRTIFGFARRPSNNVLFLCFPGNRTRSKHGAKTARKSPSHGVAGPIRVTVSSKMEGASGRKKNPFSRRTLEIAKQTQGSKVMWLQGVVHELTQNMD